MNVLFLADPFEQLKPLSDTSLFLVRECFRRGFSCYWGIDRDLSWNRSSVSGNFPLVEKPGEIGVFPTLGRIQTMALENFDFIFLRKEPPFDDSYLRLCWLLSPYEDQLVISNPASVLLRHHEKMLAFEAIIQGILDKELVIETCVTDQEEVATGFVRSLRSERVILKPWLGNGGRDVQLIQKSEFMKSPAQYFPGSERQMIQPFDPAIFDEGDRRVLFAGRECIGDFLRLPQGGSYLANLSRGAKAVLRELSDSERNILQRLGPWLENIGVDFAGVDLINGKLSEVNITSPTGVGSLLSLTGVDVTSRLVDQVILRRKLRNEKSSAFY